MEVLQHHFGFPDVFLTVTPDDENTILLDVYAFKDLDLENKKWEEICRMSNDEIKERAKARKQLRLSVPGICAWTFENQLDAIIKHVIGWEGSKGENIMGYYGKCEAFAASIEEQGRKTLHAHFIMWIKGIRKQWEILHDATETKERQDDAKQNLCDFIDRVSSCKLIGDSIDSRSCHRMFPHQDTDDGNSIECCPWTRGRPRNTTSYYRKPATKRSET